jgi:hypothetical protein
MVVVDGLSSVLPFKILVSVEGITGCGDADDAGTAAADVGARAKVCVVRKRWSPDKLSLLMR